MTSSESFGRLEPSPEGISAAAKDPSLIALRITLARFASETFARVGTVLHLTGHIIGSDRTLGTSPFGHGSDEAVAISMLLRIASQLISASTDLFSDGRPYAAAALVRQIVEVEYRHGRLNQEIAMRSDG